MNCKLDRSLTEGRLIRDVGPNKMMTLISYKLTEEMIQSQSKKREGSELDQENKRINIYIVYYTTLMHLNLFNLNRFTFFFIFFQILFCSKLKSHSFI